MTRPAADWLLAIALALGVVFVGVSIVATSAHLSATSSFDDNRVGVAEWDSIGVDATTNGSTLALSVENPSPVAVEANYSVVANEVVLETGSLDLDPGEHWNTTYDLATANASANATDWRVTVGDHSRTGTVAVGDDPPPRSANASTAAQVSDPDREYGSVAAPSH